MIDNAFSERMRGRGFNRRGKPEETHLWQSRVEGVDLSDDRLSLRQGSSFVKDDRVQLAGLFKRETSFNEDSKVCGNSSPNLCLRFEGKVREQ